MIIIILIHCYILILYHEKQISSKISDTFTMIMNSLMKVSEFDEATRLLERCQIDFNTFSIRAEEIMKKPVCDRLVQTMKEMNISITKQKIQLT